MKKLNYLIILFVSMVFHGCLDPTEIEFFGSIKGVVMDEFVQKPVSGATVSISPLGKTVVTKSNGEFEFIDLEPQDYVVSVSKISYSSDSMKITVHPSVEAEANFTINTASGAVQLSKKSLDFGQENTTLAFDITNIGISSLYYNIACDSYEWLKVSPVSGKIEGSTKRPITVTIDRTKIDEDKKITLPITSNMGSGEVEIIVDFDENAPVMEVSKTELNFGESETTLYFQVKNTGKSDLEFEISENKSWLSIAANSYTVAAGGYEVVTATVDRDQLKQSDIFDLLVTSNGGDATIEISIDYAVYNAVMEVSTETLDFGDAKSTIVFQIENSGNIDLTFECTENEDWFSLSASSYTVSPNNVAHLTASIDRTLVTQKKELELLITSNGGYKTINVTAEPYVPTPVLAVMPEELDFGDAETSMFFKVRNDGDAQLTFAITEALDWLSLTTTSYDVTPNNEVMVTATIDRSLITESQNRTVYITSNGGTKEIVVKVVKLITLDDATVTSLDDDMPVTITGAKMVGDDYEIYLDITNNNRSWEYLIFGTYGDYEISTYVTDNLNNTYWLPQGSSAVSQVTLKINNVYGSCGSRGTDDFSLNATFPVVVIIKNINADATSLKKVQIGCYAYDRVGYDVYYSDRRYILIEDLPIIR